MTANIFQVPDTVAVSNLRAAIDKQKVAPWKTPHSKTRTKLWPRPNPSAFPPHSLPSFPKFAPGIDDPQETGLRHAGKYRVQHAGVSRGKNIVVYINKKEDSQLAKFSLTTVLDKATGLTVADKLKQDIYAAKESQWMNNHLVELRLGAAVTVNHPFLKEQYDAWADAVRKQIQASNAAAAAAGTPASAPAMQAASPAGTPPAGNQFAPIAPIPLPPASQAALTFTPVPNQTTSRRNLDVPAARFIFIA